MVGGAEAVADGALSSVRRMPAKSLSRCHARQKLAWPVAVPHPTNAADGASGENPMVDVLGAESPVAPPEVVPG